MGEVRVGIVMRAIFLSSYLRILSVFFVQQISAIAYLSSLNN